MRETAELTLVYAVPVVTKASAHSKLCGMQKRLQTLAKESLDKLPTLSDVNKLRTVQAMDEWGVKSGWLHSAVHVGIIVSFCAVILEQSGYSYNPKIYETIINIVDHLIKGDDFKDEYITQGQEAANIWLTLRGDRVMNTTDYEKEIKVTVKHINQFIKKAGEDGYTRLVDEDIATLEALVDYLREELPTSDEEAELIREQEACIAKLSEFRRTKNEKYKIG